MLKAFKDNVFTVSHSMSLAGCGVFCAQLVVDCFKEEFQNVLDLEVAYEPQTLASPWCCINSVQSNDRMKGNAVSLAIGNAIKIISVYDDNNLNSETSSIPAEYQ